MGAEPDRFFKGPTDVTSSARFSTAVLLGMVGLFLAASLVFLWFVHYRGTPDLGKFELLAWVLPLIIISIPFRVFGGKIRALVNAPIVRAITIEDGVLVQREACMGRRQCALEENRVRLDEHAVAYVNGPITVFRTRGSEIDKILGVLDSDFLSDGAKEDFMRFAHAAGVQFEKGLPPAFGDAKPRRKRH